MTRDCTHGQLARSCNICDLEQEIAMLRQEYAALVAAAEREACARACQAVIDGGIYDGSQQYAAAACRNGILARGEKGQS